MYVKEPTGEYRMASRDEAISFIKEKTVMKGETITNFATLKRLLLDSIGFDSIESLKFFGGDSRNRIFTEKTFEGTVNQCLVSLREVMRWAIEENVVTVFMAHNHPSGDVNPSSSDIELTKTFLKAFKIMEIRLLDHVIVSYDKKEGKAFSFTENALMR